MTDITEEDKPLKGLAYLKRSNSIFVRTLVTYILIFMIPFALFGISIYYWASSTVASQTNRTYLGRLEGVVLGDERARARLERRTVGLRPPVGEAPVAIES